MYGLLKGACRGLSGEQRKEWRSHQCSVCSSLGQGFGQAARVATSYDGALLSVLWEAQLPERVESRRSATRCPLSPFRRRVVPDPDAAGRRYARGIAILSIWAKAEDWLADGDVWWVRLPGIARWLRVRAREAQRELSDLGCDVRGHLQAVSHHSALERSSHSLDVRCVPVEEAYGAVFAHTASLSGAPQNAECLLEMGRAYGRLTYLLDAVEDMQADRRQGKPNLLLDCLGLQEAHAALPSLAGEAWGRVKGALGRLTLVRHDQLLAESLVDRVPRQLGAIRGQRPRDDEAQEEVEGASPSRERVSRWHHKWSSAWQCAKFAAVFGVCDTPNEDECPCCACCKCCCGDCSGCDDCCRAWCCESCSRLE